MAFTSTNPVSVGDPTKKDHFDALFNNTLYFKDAPAIDTGLIVGFRGTPSADTVSVGDATGLQCGSG